MNVRTTLSAVAFVAFVAPLAAHADAPSGDFYDLFPCPTGDVGPVVTDRSEYRGNAEFTLSDLTTPAATVVTRDDVRHELAAAPMPKVDA